MRGVRKTHHVGNRADGKPGVLQKFLCLLYARLVKQGVKAFIDVAAQELAQMPLADIYPIRDFRKRQFFRAALPDMPDRRIDDEMV